VNGARDPSHNTTVDPLPSTQKENDNMQIARLEFWKDFLTRPEPMTMHIVQAGETPWTQETFRDGTEVDGHYFDREILRPALATEAATVGSIIEAMKIAAHQWKYPLHEHLAWALYKKYVAICG
jgi:hypothetical protein